MQNRIEVDSPGCSESFQECDFKDDLKERLRHASLAAMLDGRFPRGEFAT